MDMLLFLYALFFIACPAVALAYFSPPSDPATSSAANNRILTGMIDSLLPQTQCGECGYAGCLPYARAIVKGAADINQCPPGGAATVRIMAEMLGRNPKPLTVSKEEMTAELVAIIDEQTCIGCVKCIRACPVDAIIGAPKQMHTVIAMACTGCGLCLPPCPVDCITMQTLNREQWRWVKPGEAVVTK